MKWGKVSLVVFGALIVTALGIDAADTLSGSKGTLLSQVINSDSGGCPSGMAAIETVPGIRCVDIYEASANDSCPSIEPKNPVETTQNLSTDSCAPESKAETAPWRFVTREQSMQACARAGKRLPTSAEWYSVGLGSSYHENDCNVSSGSIAETGKYVACVTQSGVYDLVGNVWEWVTDDIIDGMYNSRNIPETGYVLQVDSHGVATVSTSTEQDLFGGDYFWSDREGAFGMIRGGFYGSDSDAGLFSVHADTPPTLSGTAIGFRCVL